MPRGSIRAMITGQILRRNLHAEEINKCDLKEEEIERHLNFKGMKDKGKGNGKSSAKGKSKGFGKSGKNSSAKAGPADSAEGGC
mmetsp:Transcript_25663/g.81000  ORF Transcript_25663/g.81000 Transcript_25663/m.81000 type:complete len:84 (+) Transcript_25663:183-434(+)